MEFCKGCLVKLDELTCEIRDEEDKTWGFVCNRCFSDSLKQKDTVSDDEWSNNLKKYLEYKSIKK